MATKDYYKGITIQYKGDATNLSKVLSQINSEMRQSQGAARALDAALKWDGGNVNLINDRIKVTEKQIESTTKRLDALKQALAEAKDPEVIERLTRQADIAESKLKGLKNQLVNLNAAASADDGLGKAAAKLEGIGSTLSTVGQSMSAMGDKMTMGLTVPIVAAGVATVGAATTIDNALTEVRKTVDGTEQDYQKLHDAAIEYSKTNAVTAEQVLNVQALGAQLGYAKDELEMIGRVGSGMDIATDMNAEQATTEMAQFANITKMAHSESENYASTIIDLGNNMATTESKTSSMAQRIAAAGTQVGMSQADILGVAAALSSVGMEAEAGGTAISTIISNIDKDIATGSANLSTWAETAGMSAEQFAAAWKSSPVDALAAVLAGMESATQSGGNMTVMLESLGVSSIRQTDAMKRLANDSAILTSAVDRANKAWQDNTALSEEVANKNDSISAKFQMLQNRVTAILEKIGKPLADALLAILDAAQPLFDMIENAATSFAGLDKGTQKMIVQMVALAAAAGPVQSVVGRIVEGVGGLISAIGTGTTAVANFAKYMQDGGRASESFAKALAESTVPAMDDAAKRADMVSAKVAGVGQAFEAMQGAIAVAAVAWMADQFKSMVDEIQLVDDATHGMNDVIREADISYASYAESVRNAAEGTTTIGQALNTANDSLRQSAEYNKGVAASLKEMEDNVSSAERYAATIKELSSVGNLSAAQQEQLKQAVDGYNEVTGAAIRITNSQSGELNTLVGNIDKVTEAYARQEQMKVYTKLVNEALEEQIRRQKDYEKTLNDTNAAMHNAGTYAMAWLRSLNPISNVMNITQFGNMAMAVNGVSDAYKDATSDVDYYQKAAEAAGMTTEQYTQYLKELFPELNNTGDAATEAGNAMREAAQQAAEEQRRANEQIIAQQQAANEAQLKEQQAANDQALKERQKANERALKEQQKANERANKELRKQQEAEEKALQKQLAAEEDAIRKSNDAKLAQQRKANEQQESVLRKSLDKRIESIKKALDAEIAAKRKANAKALKEAKDADAAETKAFKAETDARIAEMDRELKAKLKAIDDASGVSAIDARIKELQGENDAEDRALKQREQNEKIAELRMAVEKAKSRRKRAEAEKDLNDYLAQIQHEQREQERKDEIDRLNEQKSNIADETQAKKDALTEQYEQQKAQYEAQRAEQLERENAQREEDYERLSEFLSNQLDQRREAADAIIEQEREKANEQVEVMREQHQQQEDALKEMLDRQLEATREAHSERLEQVKEQHSEILDAQREAQQEQLDAQREAQQAELDEMRAAQQAELEQMRAAQDQELQALREALDAEVQEIISGGEAMAAAAANAAQQTAQNMAAGLNQMPTDAATAASKTLTQWVANVNDMPWQAKNLADTTGHNLQERLNAYVMPTTDAGKALRNAALREIEGLPNEGRQKGEGMGSGLSGGIGSKEGETSSSANRLAEVVKSAWGDMPNAARGYGTGVGSGYASGVSEGGASAHTNAQNIADGVSNALQRPSDNSSSWGYDMMRNFNNAIVDFWNNTLVKNVENIAQGIANLIGHSTPKEGPMVGDDMWFVHLGQNLEGGLKRTAPSILSAVEDIAQGVADGMDVQLDIDPAKTLRDRMRSEEAELALQTQRWARVMEQNFSPDLTARYDANLNYARRGTFTSTAAAFGTAAGPNITMNLNLKDVRIDSSMDIHRTAKDLAAEVVREVEASMAIA